MINLFFETKIIKTIIKMHTNQTIHSIKELKMFIIKLKQFQSLFQTVLNQF